MASENDTDPKHIIPAETEKPSHKTFVAIKTGRSGKKRKMIEVTALPQKPASIADTQTMRFTGKSVAAMRKRLKLTVSQAAACVLPAVIFSRLES